jgi:hypothetical protein
MSHHAILLTYVVYVVQIQYVAYAIQGMVQVNANVLLMEMIHRDRMRMIYVIHRIQNQ